MVSRSFGMRRIMFIVAALTLMLVSLVVLAPNKANAYECSIVSPTELGKWDLDGDGYLETVKKGDIQHNGQTIIEVDSFTGAHVGCFQWYYSTDVAVYNVTLDGYPGEELLILRDQNFYTGPTIDFLNFRRFIIFQLNFGPFNSINWTKDTNGIPGNEVVMYKKSTYDANGNWHSGLITIYDHHKGDIRYYDIPTGCSGEISTSCSEHALDMAFANTDGIAGDEIYTSANWCDTGTTNCGTVSKTITDRLSNLPTRGMIDSPTAGQTLKGKKYVSGWFLDDSHVKKIEVFVDGVLKGQATEGISREDVYNDWPQYKNHNSGYQYSLDTYALSNGTHTLLVRETGIAGQMDLTRTFTVNNLPTIGAIETPANNATLKGVNEIKGWLLDESKVDTIEVLLDGTLLGNATYGLLREDIYNAHPDYNNHNSGYKFTLDTYDIPNGSHTLTVRETGKSGLQKTMTRTVNVDNLPTLLNLSTVSNNMTISGFKNLRGWALDESGVVKVDVLVDDVFVGRATYGEQREDIYNLHPEYNNHNSGYNYNLNTYELSNGTHTLTIRETGDSGRQKIITRTVIVDNLPSLLNFGSVADGSTISGFKSIRGWALDPSDVLRIQVFVDDVLIGRATYGEQREDVYNLHPEYNNHNSGYNYSLNTYELSNGTHTITVKETGNSGLQKSITKTVTVDNLPTLLAVEEPYDGQIIDFALMVSGWALDDSGVSRIEVLLNGAVVGQATYGLQREGVYNAHPEYNNHNSGYSFAMAMSSFPNGFYTVTVRETGNSGLQKSVTRTVRVVHP